MDKEEYEDYEASLPIELSLNHKLLGADENTICEACKNDEHWNCCLATWCMCDDPTDGDQDAYLDDIGYGFNPMDDILRDDLEEKPNG